MSGRMGCCEPEHFGHAVSLARPNGLAALRRVLFVEATLAVPLVLKELADVPSLSGPFRALTVRVSTLMGVGVRVALGGGGGAR